jgi:hypothetical protein
MEQQHASTLESLNSMLAAFEPQRHGGELMAWPYVGKEVNSEAATDATSD